MIEKKSKIYHVYNVFNTDYYVEIAEKIVDNEIWVDVWLYKQNYGIKTFMFGIKKVENYIELIKNNVERYIIDYEEEYVEE